MINPETIKKEFPIFAHLPKGYAYCDSVATSQTPQCVLDAMNAYYTEHRASVRRSSYAMAETATELFEDARADIARFIHASPDEIIFTGGATIASNMAYFMLADYLPLRPGDEIVTSVLEHHSNLLPAQHLAEREGLIIKYAPLATDYGLDTEKTLALITPKTRILALTLASNVTGAMVDVRHLIDKAHASGAVAVIDASAYVGHASLDVMSLDADMLFFSGHKMCGPTGIGVLYGKRRLLGKLRPVFVGGGMADEATMEGMRCTDVPYRFEAGTPPIAEVIGLGSAVRYLEGVGMEEVRAHIRDLIAYGIEKIGAVPGVTLHSMTDPDKNIGIVSFTVKGVHAHDVAHILGEQKVAVRAGHHCAEPLSVALGVPATVRAGFHIYNTREDIDTLCEAISVVTKTFV